MRIRASRRATAVLAVLFAVYLVLLVWIVLWKLHVPYLGRPDMREIKLIPFIPAAGFGANAPFEIVANAVLFVPFGVYLRALAPSWSLSRTIVVLAGASLLLEVAEYVTAVGSSDVTDVIVNTAGGVAGLGMVDLVRRRAVTRAVSIIARVCAVGTAIALVVVVVHIASFPSLPPPRADGTPTIIE